MNFAFQMIKLLFSILIETFFLENISSSSVKIQHLYVMFNNSTIDHIVTMVLHVLPLTTLHRCSKRLMLETYAWFVNKKLSGQHKRFPAEQILVEKYVVNILYHFQESQK